MKSKYQISVLVLGIIVAILCIYKVHIFSKNTIKKEGLSNVLLPQNDFIFKTLPQHHLNTNEIFLY